MTQQENSKETRKFGKNKILLIVLILTIAVISLAIWTNHTETTADDYNIEFLKIVDSHSFAKYKADKIKADVSAGKINYEELGLKNESELDKLVLNAQEREAKKDLILLREIDNHHFAQRTAENIIKAVAGNATSWEELGTSKSELEQMVLDAQEREINKDLAFLRVVSDHDMAQWIKEDITEAVNANATSWEELGTSKSELEQMVLDAQEREAKENLILLKRADSKLLAEVLEKSIIIAVTENATSWEELGTSKSELEQMVLDAQEK